MVVLNFNGSSSIEHCLRSIRNQSCPPDEVILVDNNSTDGSADEAERQFPGLRVIRNHRNLGFSEGNNVGIRASSGELVLLANNDVVLNRDAISNLIEGLGGNGGIVSGLILYDDGAKVWSYGGQFDQLTGMHWHNLQGTTYPSVVRASSKPDYAPGALVLVRRSFLERAGLLDAYFFLYGDDIDLALKAIRLGYSVNIVPVPVAIHLVSQSVRRIEQDYDLLGYYMMNRSMFYLYFAQLPAPMALTSTLFQVAFTYFEVLLFRRPLPYVYRKMSALASAIRDLGKARNARARAKKLGRLPVMLRLGNLIDVARDRANDRVYFW